ncbi:MAG: hypothetical protein ACPHFR_06345 [Cycloclasticus sp.]
MCAIAEALAIPHSTIYRILYRWRQANRRLLPDNRVN